MLFCAHNAISLLDFTVQVMEYCCHNRLCDDFTKSRLSAQRLLLKRNVPHLTSCDQTFYFILLQNGFTRGLKRVFLMMCCCALCKDGASPANYSELSALTTFAICKQSRLYCMRGLNISDENSVNPVDMSSGTTRWFIIIGPLCLNWYSSAIKLYFYVKFYTFVVLILSHATYS